MCCFISFDKIEKVYRLICILYFYRISFFCTLSFVFNTRFLFNIKNINYLSVKSKMPLSDYLLARNWLKGEYIYTHLDRKGTNVKSLNLLQPKTTNNKNKYYYLNGKKIVKPITTKTSIKSNKVSSKLIIYLDT